MTKKQTKSDMVVVVRVQLDDISEKYAQDVTADSLVKRLGESYYASSVCDAKANNKFQRTAKRGR